MIWLVSCMVMRPWPCESLAENAFPHSEGTHTRCKDCPCFAYLFIPIFMVFLHQSTPCKVIKQAANSVNSDLKALSSVQATSLWRVLYHGRAKSLSRKLRSSDRKSALWHCENKGKGLHYFTWSNCSVGL